MIFMERNQSFPSYQVVLSPNENRFLVILRRKRRKSRRKNNALSTRISRCNELIDHESTRTFMISYNHWKLTIEYFEWIFFFFFLFFFHWNGFFLLLILSWNIFTVRLLLIFKCGFKISQSTLHSKAFKLTCEAHVLMHFNNHFFFFWSETRSFSKNEMILLINQELIGSRHYVNSSNL